MGAGIGEGEVPCPSNIGDWYSDHQLLLLNTEVHMKRPVAIVVVLLPNVASSRFSLAEVTSREFKRLVSFFLVIFLSAPPYTFERQALKTRTFESNCIYKEN